MKATRITAAPSRREVEVPAGFEPAIRVLQTRALPLGYGARPPCRVISCPPDRRS